MGENVDRESEPIHEGLLQESKEIEFAEETILKLEVEILTPFSEEDNGTDNILNEFEINKTLYNAKKKDCQMVETTNSVTRRFFQLRSTDPFIILGFIDIVRRHPCHWNSLDYDFGHKDKRDESSKIICRELRDLYNICISPQLARSSILSLIRWFEREYLRSVLL
ncbi:uncharacterized protein LOC118757275, partial [Rhagoletis pomonella]|uniref:uncharacterized protein LOC118757275 n=1 Tax=Rhagoletis pomonella TaxID=28610 RepID=UPI001781E4F2